MSLLTKKRTCLLLLITSFIGVATAKADTSRIKLSRLEVLMNVTNSISRFTGNGIKQTVFEDPFLFGLKLTNLKKSCALRLGINFDINKSN